MNNTIHTAYALDDNYTEFVCVSMTSLLHNTKRHAHFHVLENRLSEENKQILQSVSERYDNADLTFYHVETDNRFVLNSASPYSTEIYFRLYLPMLLKGISRVLYLDADTVVKGDVSELYDTELEDCYAAAVPDHMFGNCAERKRMLNLNDYDRYCNTGVMLLNLELCTSELFEYAVEVSPTLYIKNNKSVLNDQDALNFIFAGKVKLLPWKFNFMYKFDTGSEISYSLEESVQAIKNPVIVHYIGSCLRDIAQLSPKMIFNPHWKLWHEYKALTSYAKIGDKERIERYNARVLNLEKSVIDPDSYMNFHRYAAFSNASELIKNKSAGRKIAVWGKNIHTRLLITLLTSKGITVDIILDGLVENQLERLFEFVTQSPLKIKGKSDEFFVVLDICTDKTAQKVRVILNEYGYSENDYYYVYEPLYKAINSEV